MVLTGSKIGFDNNVSTSAFTIVSNAAVTTPTGEGARVISTSVQDSSAGTGIQKALIKYFDTSYSSQQEIVTLNGTTPVLTSATDILFIEDFSVFQIGSSGGAVGTVSLQSTDGTRLFARIDPGGNQFLRALHYVTPGKVGEITDIIVSGTSGGVSFVVFREIDYTPDGGNIVLISDLSFTLIAEVMSISLDLPVRCDATRSTTPLRMGISALGLAASQSALVSFRFDEI